MVFVFCFCELGSHNVTQAGLELIAIFLPLPPGQLLRLQEIPPPPPSLSTTKCILIYNFNDHLEAILDIFNVTWRQALFTSFSPIPINTAR